MKRFFLLIAFLSLFSFSFSQESGCTDVHASNYNTEAQKNDGSCVYDALVLQPQILIKKLPASIDETSGIILFNNGIWTHNDSGGEAAIYKFDTQTGKILQTISLENASNYDIEDITQDDEYIFVGDFGNNYGTRKDLHIYKIAKADIPKTGDASISCEIISFSYNDQTVFKKKNRKNDHDCEAIASIGDYLYIFSKNWANEESKFYKIPKTPGNYQLDIQDQFNVRGLITGADYRADIHTLILVGYENFVPFVWVMWDFKDDQLFKGNNRRADFAYIQGAQTEGICFLDKEHILISSENSFYPPQLYQIKLDEIIAPTSTEKYQVFKITVHQQQTDGKEQNADISIKGLQTAYFDIEIYNVRWEKVAQYGFQEKNFQNETKVILPTSSLKRGVYFIRVKQGKNVGFQKLMIR